MEEPVESFVALVDEPASPGAALWFAFKGSQLLVGAGAELPCCDDLGRIGVNALRRQYLGVLGETHCYSAEVHDEAPAPEGMAFTGLRGLFGRFDEALFGVAGRAFQVMDWDRTHQYCGRCGTPTERHPGERARACPSCRLSVYPRICPAVMVLIHDGRNLLLARKAQFPAGRYSAIAGFVEAGEALEETIARESKEEVGVDVKNIRYFGSQPWPFPNSLMIAYTAEYAGGEIRPDGIEIEDARWFDCEELPNRPDRISIARKLIDGVAARLAVEYPR